VKHFQFQIASEIASTKVPGGWTKADLAQVVLVHMRAFSPEQTERSLRKHAGWRTVANIKPEQYGTCIAHLCYEMTRRPHLMTQPLLPKKGTDDNLT
jgi:hypothetical protein